MLRSKRKQTILSSKEPQRSWLKLAEDLVSGEKNKDYGEVVDSFSRIAQLWSVYLRGRASISAMDVGIMMILLKCSRSITSKKQDTFVDIAGYIRCIQSIVESETDQ